MWCTICITMPEAEPGAVRGIRAAEHTERRRIISRIHGRSPAFSFIRICNNFMKGIDSCPGGTYNKYHQYLLRAASRSLD